MSEVTHRTIETNGIRMHIAEQGEGPLVLLCHGFPESWYSWRNQLRALADAGSGRSRRICAVMDRRAGGNREIYAAGFQDHGIFEFAEIEIAAAGEGDRAGIRLVERHGLSAPDRN